MFPAIEGQLGWDSEREEAQYIISWGEGTTQSERVTSMYGNFEVISEGHASNVSVLTTLVSVESGATIQHPNGKLSVEIPKAVVNNAPALYIAVSSGYDVDPPEGKMFVAGGVAYNTTALPLAENEENRVELTKLDAAMTLRFSYSADLDKDTLELCYLDPNVENGSWAPVAEEVQHPEAGVATVTTTTLGAYALMMRQKATLAEVEKTLEEVREAFNSLKLATNGSNGNAVPVA